jgi:YVTN family beta-propeller protein
MDLNAQTLHFAGSNMDLTNADTFNVTGSTLDFDTSAGTLIQTAGRSLNHVSVTGSGNVATQSGLHAMGNFTQTSGNFMNNHALDVDGSFSQSGASQFTAPSTTMNVGGSVMIHNSSFSHNNGTLIMDGAGSEVLGTGGNHLNNFQMSGTGTVATTDANLVIERDYYQDRGTFIAPTWNGQESTKNLGLHIQNNFSKMGGTFDANSGRAFFAANDGQAEFAYQGGVSFWHMELLGGGNTFLFNKGDANNALNIVGNSTWVVQGGGPSSLITLACSDCGSGDQWYVNPIGGYNVSAVHVSNSFNMNNNIPGTNNGTNSDFGGSAVGNYIDPANSIDGGGNSWWFPSNAPEVPDAEPPLSEDPPAIPVEPPGGEEDEPTPTPEEPEAEEPEQGSAQLGTEEKQAPCAEAGTEVYVHEGAVDVNGIMVYDGESVYACGDSKSVSINKRQIFVSNMNGVQIFRGRIHEKIREITLNQKTAGLAASFDGRQVYFTMPETQSMAAIQAGSLETGLVVKGLDAEPLSVALNEKGNRAYVANSHGDSVQVIEPASSKIVSTFPVDIMPAKVIVSADEKSIFASSRLDQSVVKMDAFTGEVLAKAKFEGDVFGLALSKDGLTVYAVETAKDQVWALSASDLTKLVSIPVGDAPHHVVSSRVENKIFVTNYKSHDVSVIDVTEGMSEIARIPVGKRPMGLDITPQGDKVYVANTISGTVSVIEVKDLKVIDSFDAGTAPTQIAISSPARPRYDNTMSDKF